MDAHTLAHYVDGLISQCLKCDGSTCTIEIFPPDENLDPELRAVTDKLLKFFTQFKESCRFTRDIANGRLDSTISRDNVLAMPQKALQASLRHLTWQAQRVADGDLNHQVHFLGDFSDAFNRMINALQDKATIEQRLRENEKNMNNILNSIDDAVMSYSLKDECFVYLSPSLEKIYGISVEEFLKNQTLPESHRSRASR